MGWFQSKSCSAAIKKKGSSLNRGKNNKEEAGISREEALNRFLSRCSETHETWKKELNGEVVFEDDLRIKGVPVTFATVVSEGVEKKRQNEQDKESSKVHRFDIVAEGTVSRWLLKHQLAPLVIEDRLARDIAENAKGEEEYTSKSRRMLFIVMVAEAVVWAASMFFLY